MTQDATATAATIHGRMSDHENDPSAPEYTLYRAKPRGLRARLRGETDLDELRQDDGRAPGRPGRRSRIPGGWRDRVTPKRVILGLLGLIVGWLLLSLVLFLISAQIEQSNVDSAAKAALTGSGFPLTSANTILVLGSDQRPKGSKEPGASTSGPSRSDSILLMRIGGGSSARLSIPRDTVVNIPGHGENKINAAYAFGGAALTIHSVEQLLPGVKINHLVEINFTNFPKLIDAMGGIDVKTNCVISKINGGYKNGGVTLRLHHGTNHLSGKQALALARTRHNLCNPRENDLTRARRQQKIFSAMKSKLTSPSTFFRLPWVAWDAPKALRSDMGGFSMLGLMGALATSGTPPTQVLQPSGVTTLRDGESALTVSPTTAAAAAQKFLKG
jgi:LCP family protein required for cell wall assembly